VQAQPQELIGRRYRVLSPIGQGGMGTVWLCRDETLHREVAVKGVGLLPGESVTDSARALREARSSAALSHRNVVTVFDVVEEEGRIWLVMEHVPGRSLSAMVREDGPLPPERVADIGAQVADGLAAAHEVGTVHRDVKPGNVLFDEAGDVHLTDFGIARLTDVSAITSSGLVVGTAAYLSPEQVRGEGATPASDVYALGLVLIEALTGSPAFTGTASEAALARLDRTPEVPETASPALALLLTTMTASEPSARPAASDVVDTLGADRTTVLPVGADVTQAIPIEPVVLAAPRRRVPVALIVVAAVVLLFALGLLSGANGTSPWGVSTAATTTVPPPTTPVTNAPPPTTAPPPVSVAPEPAPKHKGKKGH